LPKNLTLLQVPHAQVEVCLLHQKNLEAFCETEKVLVCIDCILLGEHKSHEVSAISESSKKARALVNSFIDTSKRLNESLKAALECVETHRGELKGKVKEQREVISKQFNKMIQAIKDYEEKLNANLNEFLEQQYDKLNQNMNTIREQLNSIEHFLKETESINTECDYNILYKYNDIIKEAEQATKDMSLIGFVVHLPEFNLKQELTKLWKLISSDIQCSTLSKHEEGDVSESQEKLITKVLQKTSSTKFPLAV
jgi:F0F1-type ATP synthase membrane subunit b/b'